MPVDEIDEKEILRTPGLCGCRILFEAVISIVSFSRSRFRDLLNSRNTATSTAKAANPPTTPPAIAPALEEPLFAEDAPVEAGGGTIIVWFVRLRRKKTNQHLQLRAVNIDTNLKANSEKTAP